MTDWKLKEMDARYRAEAQVIVEQSSNNEEARAAMLDLTYKYARKIEPNHAALWVGHFTYIAGDYLPEPL